MDWTDEEVIQCVVAYQGRGGMHAAMTRAVELAATRGGTMTARDRKELREALNSGAAIPHGRECLAAALDDLDTQGATVATLQAKVAALDAQLTSAREDHRCACDTRESLSTEVERLKAEGSTIRGMYQAAASHRDEYRTRMHTAESRLAAIRSEILPTLTSVSRERLGRVLEGDAPQEAKDEPPCIYKFLSEQCSASRHPCSPTCTHEDAASPGHPERVKERSEAVIAASNPNDGHPDALPEGPLEVVDPAFIAGYEQGAEAMRRACLEALQAACHHHGVMWFYQHAKQALEGTAP